MLESHSRSNRFELITAFDEGGVCEVWQRDFRRRSSVVCQTGSPTTVADATDSGTGQTLAVHPQRGTCHEIEERSYIENSEKSIVATHRAENLPGFSRRDHIVDIKLSTKLLLEVQDLQALFERLTAAG